MLNVSRETQPSAFIPLIQGFNKSFFKKFCSFKLYAPARRISKYKQIRVKSVPSPDQRTRYGLNTGKIASIENGLILKPGRIDFKLELADSN